VNRALLIVLAILATAGGSTFAAFACLERWIDSHLPAAEAGSQATVGLRAKSLSDALPAAPAVQVSIEADLEPHKFSHDIEGFMPFFDIRECTPDRLRIDSRSGDSCELGGFVTTLQLEIKRKEDGSIQASLTKSVCGGCLRSMSEPNQPAFNTTQEMSARIVFSRDWFGATEQYYLGIYFLRAADAALPERPVWYRIRP
jgi:hypothetical protein